MRCRWLIGNARNVRMLVDVEVRRKVVSNTPIVLAKSEARNQNLQQSTLVNRETTKSRQE